MRRFFRIGKIHKTAPPGVEQCADGSYTDARLRGRCSYHGGLLVKNVRSKKEREEVVLNEAHVVLQIPPSINKMLPIWKIGDTVEFTRHYGLWPKKTRGSVVKILKDKHGNYETKIFTGKNLSGQKLFAVGPNDVLQLIPTALNIPQEPTEPQTIVPKNIKEAVIEERKDVVLQENIHEEEQEKPENYYIVNSDNKAELHFSYSMYKNLPQNTKSEIKKYFNWGRQRNAWVSKGDYRTWGSKGVIEKLKLPLYSIEKRKTFAESMEAKVDKAENRAERFETKAEKTTRKAEQLKSEFNRLKHDWSWVTQPYTNTAGGRRFRKHKEKVLQRYDKGMALGRTVEYYEERVAAALKTMDQKELNDYGFLNRRIKETTKKLKELYEYADRINKNIESLKSGKILKRYDGTEVTFEDLVNALDNATRDIDFTQTKLIFYEAKKEEFEEQNPNKVFNKENMKGAKFVKVSGDEKWHKIFKLNPTTVNHSVRELFIEKDFRNTPYSEVTEISFDDNFKMIRFGYEQTTNAIGNIPTYLNWWSGNTVGNTAIGTALGLIGQPAWKELYYRVLRKTSNHEFTLYLVYYLYNRRKKDNIPAQYLPEIQNFVYQYNL